LEGGELGRRKEFFDARLSLFGPATIDCTPFRKARCFEEKLEGRNREGGKGKGVATRKVFEGPRASFWAVRRYFKKNCVRKEEKGASVQKSCTAGENPWGGG